MAPWQSLSQQPSASTWQREGGGGWGTVCGGEGRFTALHFEDAIVHPWCARRGIISHFLTNILSDLVYSELKLPRGARSHPEKPHRPIVYEPWKQFCAEKKWKKAMQPIKCMYFETHRHCSFTQTQTYTDTHTVEERAGGSERERRESWGRRWKPGFSSSIESLLHAHSSHGQLKNLQLVNKSGD